MMISPFRLIKLDALETSTNNVSESYASCFDIEAVRQVINRLGYELALKQQDRGSFCFSAVGLSAILASLFHGWDEKNKSLFLNAVRLNEMAPQIFEQAVNYTLKVLDIHEQWTDISLANAIGIKGNFKESYRQAFQIMCEGEVFSSDQMTVNRINAWVSDKTQKKITNFLPEGILSQSDGIILNALYFQSMWKELFNEAGYQPFQFANGDTVEVDAIKRKDYFLCHFMSDCTLVEVPYQGNHKMAFIAVKPSRPNDLKNLLQTLTFDRVNSMRKAAKLQEVTLMMPALKMHSETIDWKSHLAQMGIPVEAELPELASGMRLDKVIQTTKLELDAYGTKIASATAGMVTRSANSFVSLMSPYAFFVVVEDLAIAQGIISDAACLYPKK